MKGLVKGYAYKLGDEGLLRASRYPPVSTVYRGGAAPDEDPILIWNPIVPNNSPQSLVPLAGSLQTLNGPSSSILFTWPSIGPQLMSVC